MALASECALGTGGSKSTCQTSARESNTRRGNIFRLAEELRILAGHHTWGTSL